MIMKKPTTSCNEPENATHLMSRFGQSWLGVQHSTEILKVDWRCCKMCLLKLEMMKRRIESSKPRFFIVLDTVNGS